MSWRTATLRHIAPPSTADIKPSPCDRVWSLSLDQIESGTGAVLEKRYVQADEAGSSTFYFDTDNVLYSKLRPYLNKVVLPDEPGIATTELIPLRPNKDVVDARYLAYYLRSQGFVNQASHQVAGANLPRVVMNWFWTHEVPLPTPSEQRRIVELLDQADALRRLRREADAKAERILPALFLRMFGDPATNPMRWPVKPVSEAIGSVDAGWSAPSEGRPSIGNERGVLKVSAVTSGRFRPEENKAVLEIPDDKTLVTPRRGDLLFSRANTRELVAATCLVENDYPSLFLSDKLWRLTPHEGITSALFLKQLFWNDGVRDKFRASSSGSSGSMLNISKDAMLRTLVPLPPFEMQMQFERTAWSVIEKTTIAANTGNDLERLWSRLLQKSFAGNLTAKWRQAHMQELLLEVQQQAEALSLSMSREFAA